MLRQLLYVEIFSNVFVDEILQLSDLRILGQAVRKLRTELSLSARSFQKEHHCLCRAKGYRATKILFNQRHYQI